MNISVKQTSGNREFAFFKEIEEKAFNIGMEVARQLIRAALEQADMTLMAERDVKRFRDKGLRKTCIKTKCGSVEFRRRVYEDKLAQKEKYTYLLDEKIGINKVGLISESVCKMISTSICESTYRATANQVSDLTGLGLSAQAVWNVVQSLGSAQFELSERHAELAKEKQGTGIIETPIIYEENDGIWIKLQGEDRRESGPSKEMKVGIAYDGVTYHESSDGKKRRTLDNKLAFAGFMPINDFRAQKEGLIASVYDTKKIQLRVINGDGATWIQKKKGENSICVLDEFHRNKKIRECVKNKEHAELIYEELFNGDYDYLLEYIDAMANSVEDEDEIEGLKTLYSYYFENREALPKYYDRGIKIPETRDPGVIHHARLGSMESNVFTLIGNRMKGRRKSWSIRGANNLAAILCAYHTVGFENLFYNMPSLPIKAPEWIDTEKPLTGRAIKEYIGKGYEYPVQANISTAPTWLRKALKFSDLNELKYI